MKTIIQITIVAILFVAFIFAVIFGIEKNEQVECAKLAKYDREIPEFFYTSWQLEMCDIKNFKN